MIGLFTDWTRDPELFDPQREAGVLVGTLFRGLFRDWDQGA